MALGKETIALELLGLGVYPVDFGFPVIIKGFSLSCQAQAWFDINFDNSSLLGSPVGIYNFRKNTYFLNAGTPIYVPLDIQISLLEINLLFGSGRVFINLYYDRL